MLEIFGSSHATEALVSVGTGRLKRPWGRCKAAKDKQTHLLEAASIIFSESGGRENCWAVQGVGCGGQREQRRGQTTGSKVSLPNSWDEC